VISIEGNADFGLQAAAEGWPGNGHLHNPYVISGYEIDGFGYMSPIHIGNTTVYFEVRDCYLYDGSSGVYLYGVSNGILRNDTCSNNILYGMSVQWSNDNEIANSTCYRNHVGGIYAVSSDRNGVRYNTCYNNGWKYYSVFGIYCDGFSNTVDHNYCYDDNETGINVDGTGSVAYANTCTNNSNGIVASCTVRNNSCHNNYIGITVEGNAQVVGNNCSGNRFGISISGLQNTVARNLCENNSLYGIHSYGGASYNDLNNNTCLNNEADGMFFGSACTHNTLAHNKCSGNGQSGIDLLGTDHNEVRANLCDDNKQAGLYLQSCQYEVIQGNVMHRDGVVLEGSVLQNWVLNTIDQSNLVGGRPVCFLKDGNGTAVPTGKGQYIIANSKNMVISDLDTGNGSAGISLGFCSASTIVNCTSSNNTFYGVYLSHCTGISVANSTFSGVTGLPSLYQASGVYLISSTRCTVANDTISRNQIGMFLDSSANNIIANNTIANSSYVGVYLGYSSSYNEIRGNLFDNNSNYAVYVPGALHVHYTVGNMIFGNVFRHNNGATEVYDSAHIQAYDYYGDNLWNSLGYGNFWSDWQSPDSNHDGIVDNPYLIQGFPNARDNYPLTSPSTGIPVPEFPVIVPLLITILLLCGISLSRRARGPRTS
jgi:parallel beta-helix repeat protein